MHDSPGCQKLQAREWVLPACGCMKGKHFMEVEQERDFSAIFQNHIALCSLFIVQFPHVAMRPHEDQ